MVIGFYSFKNIPSSTLSPYYNKKVLFELKVLTHPVKGKSKYHHFEAFVSRLGRIRTSLKIKVFARIDHLKWGDRLTVKGTLHPFKTHNFTEPDQTFKRSDLAGILFINRKSQIVRHEPSSNFLIKWGIFLRKDIARYLDKYYMPVQKSFIKASLLGDRTNIPAPLKDIFIKTGTIHILAISGLHVGIITLILLSITGFFAIPDKIRLIIILLLLIIYNHIIGYRVPAIRSTVMFFSMLVCLFFDRDRNYLNSLFLAAFFILLLDPQSLKSLSFQLSFLATAGIIIFTPCIENIFKKSRLYSVKVVRYFLKLISASIAAQILIFPLLLFHFKMFAYSAVLANMIAIPSMTLILALAIAGYIFFHLMGFFSAVLGSINNLLIALMTYGLEQFHFIKPLSFYIRMEFFLFYFLLVVIIFHKRLILLTITKSQTTWKTALILSLFILIVLCASFTNHDHPQTPLGIYIFPTSGKSIVICTGEKRYILIDGGSSTDARRHIIPFLKKRNNRILHYIFLTSPLNERMEGLLDIIKNFKTGSFIDTGKISPVYNYHRLLELITDKNIPYNIASRGDKFQVDNIELEILNPPRGLFQPVASYKVKDSVNIKNNSMVIKLNKDGKSIIFISPIERRAVKDLHRSQSNKLRSDILVLSEFNHKDYSLYRLLESIRPRTIIVTSRYPAHEKESREVLNQLARDYNAEMIYTDEKGACRIYERERRWEVETSL
ncbi:MAG: ComEC/Rec2 family competence protein [Spirochaetes bacterium]|nr:ComEC/Rec2 family competence protein [Spirochaetota bacterium]